MGTERDVSARFPSCRATLTVLAGFVCSGCLGAVPGHVRTTTAPDLSHSAADRADFTANLASADSTDCTTGDAADFPVRYTIAAGGY